MNRGDEPRGAGARGHAGDAPAAQAAYAELQCYTLAHGDLAFIHQHVVDAWAAQHADERTKPISLAFALVGLHLCIERGFTGRQVQRVHMALAQRQRTWPAFALPRERGSMTATDVVAATTGPARDQAIHAWCASVWAAFRDSHESVADLLERHGIAGK